MDYKEKVIALLNSQELSKEQKEKLESIFPELSESEDERIRKGLIQYFSTFTLDTFAGLDPKKILSWLEKQGEQKPTDKVEPKFKVKYAGCEYNVLEVKDIAGVTFYGIEDEPNHIDYVKAENCEIISGGYGIKENGSPYPTKPAVFSEQKPAWSEEDEKAINDIMWIIEAYRKNGFNETHIQIADNSENWLKSLKDRIQLQQEWNYNDEITIETIIQEIEKIPSEKFIDNAKNKCLDWLRYRTKSLRPQNRWKPSNEQMLALDDAIAICSEKDYETECRLDNLRQDLKRLK